MTLLYLLRHGEIEWPEADCFIGQTDAPLNAQGRRQARAWSKELRPIDFTDYWSSDLQRAAETAAIVAAGRAPAVRTSRDLGEIHLGEWEGLPRRRVRERHPDLWRARGRDLAGFRPPGGESFSDLQARVVRRVRQIAADTAGAVFIAGHAGAIRVLICHCLQMPLSNLFRLRLDYGGLSIVAYSTERVEVCGLNLKPTCLSGAAGEK
jgi:probable phosphoglycerate mutase